MQISKMLTIGSRCIIFVVITAGGWLVIAGDLKGLHDHATVIAVIASNVCDVNARLLRIWLLRLRGERLLLGR